MNEEEILEILQASIESTETAAVITDIEETQKKVLYAKYPGVGKDKREMMVSFMFVPEMFPGEDKTRDIMIQIDIADDIPEENYPVLKQGISVLNYFTSRGSFLMTPDCTTLMYRNTVNIINTQSEEEIITTLLYQLCSALAITEIWVDTLYGVIGGTMDFDQFMQKISEYTGA